MTDCLARGARVKHGDEYSQGILPVEHMKRIQAEGDNADKQAHCVIRLARAVDLTSV